MSSTPGKPPASVDARWFANRLARAAIPEEFLTQSVGGGRRHRRRDLGGPARRAVTVELDGEATDTQLIGRRSSPNRRRPAQTAKVLGDRPRRPQALHRRSRRPGRAPLGHQQPPRRPYVGYELHLAVQARDVRWTNYIDKTTLGPEVPGVITTCQPGSGRHPPGPAPSSTP